MTTTAKTHVSTVRAAGIFDLLADPANFETKAKRDSLVEQLLPDYGRGGAERIVIMKHSKARGVPLLPQEEAWLAAHLEFGKQASEMAFLGEEAIEARAALDRLEAAVHAAEKRLAWQYEHLGLAKAAIARAGAEDYLRYQEGGQAGPTWQKALQHGIEVAGAKELVALLESQVIPALEQQLAAAKAELEAHAQPA